MHIRDFTLPSFYATTLNLDDCEERTFVLERAWQQGDWNKVMGLLQEGPVQSHQRDNILLGAVNQLEEEICLNFLRAVRSQGSLSARTDSNILEIAATRGFINLVAAQLEDGLIQPWSVDKSLKIAVNADNRNLMGLLLDSSFCTQAGKNEAARAAAQTGKLGSMLELLESNAISGVYTYSMSNSSIDLMLGTPFEECIWSLLIREAGNRGYWEIAKAVAICKPFELTRDDLGFLAIAAASTGQADALEEILSKVP